MAPPACRGPWDELGARSRRDARGRQARRSRPRPRVWRSARCAAQKADRSGPRAPSDPRLLVYDRGAQHLRRARYAPSHELAALQGRQGALPRRPPQAEAILGQEVASAIIARPKWRSGLLGVPTRDRRVYWGLREHPLRLSALGWLIGLLCAGCTRHAQVCDCGAAVGCLPRSVPRPACRAGWLNAGGRCRTIQALCRVPPRCCWPSRACQRVRRYLRSTVRHSCQQPSSSCTMSPPSVPLALGCEAQHGLRRRAGTLDALKRGPRARVAHSASWAAPHTTSAAAANAASATRAPSGSSTLGHAIQHGLHVRSGSSGSSRRAQGPFGTAAASRAVPRWMLHTPPPPPPTTQARCAPRAPSGPGTC